MADIKVKRGYDLPLMGAPSQNVVDAPAPSIVSIRPKEFRGVKPKILVKDGDRVAAGQPLFHDRERPEIRFPSPGGGEVVEVRYGRRRVCEQIFIKLDADESFAEGRAYSADEARQLQRAQIVEMLLDGGLWTYLRSRPYSVIPDPEATPAAIFVSASDNSPLPYRASLGLKGREEDLQLGIEVLGKLTEGKVHFCSMADETVPRLSQCEMHSFSGPYPAGQAETQIHYVHPRRTGEEVWFLDGQAAADIGEYVRTGRFPTQRVYAVTGEGATEPRHYRTRKGVSASHLDPGASPAKYRFISGNVMAGTHISSDCGIGHYDEKFTIIPAGDEPEFIGWMLPGEDKISRYRTFLSALTRPKEVSISANLQGSVRSHIVTGIYEEVCASGVLPEYLMRALHINDLEEAERLGLPDCSECGLCSFVCPSKINFSTMISDGIETILQEEDAE